MCEKKKEYMKMVAEYRKGLYSKPVLQTLFFELTDACNMSCMHCGSCASPKNKQYLPSAEVKSVIDEVAAAYDPTKILICYTGGEPLLHPDFFELVKYAASKGFYCGITTNGTLIDKATAEKMRALGVRSVSVSIDGTEKMHDWFRGKKGAYSRAVEGICNLLEVGGIYTQITTVIHKKNIRNLEELYKEALTMGVHSWRPINLEPIGRALDNSDLLLSPEEHGVLLDFIKRKKAPGDLKMKVTYGCSHYVTPDYENEVRDHFFLCTAGLLTAGVLCNGDIYACLDIKRDASLVQGNIKKDSFVEVWENRFSVFRKDRSELCKGCFECTDKEFCAGDSWHTWDFDNNRPMLCLKEALEKRKDAI